jgi:hypothetical protein
MENIIAEGFQKLSRNIKLSIQFVWKHLKGELQALYC